MISLLHPYSGVVKVAPCKYPEGLRVNPKVMTTEGPIKHEGL